MEQSLLNMIHSWNIENPNWHLLDILRGVSFVWVEGELQQALPERFCPGQYVHCMKNLAIIKKFLAANDRWRHDLNRRTGDQKVSAEDFIKLSRELTIKTWSE